MQNSKKMGFSYGSLKLMLENHLKRRWRERERQAELYISSSFPYNIIIIFITYYTTSYNNYDSLQFFYNYCFIPKLFLLYKLLVLCSYGGVAYSF